MGFIDESRAWWLEGLARGWLHVWPRAARQAGEPAEADEDSHARARRREREERRRGACTTADCSQ
jgi:hypothetical protein